jgi:hypothetical protein
MHTIFGIIGTLVSLTCFIPYGYSIWKGITKPHLFSWVIWSLVTGIAGFGQYAAGAGPSAWCTLAIAVTCTITAVISLFQGTKNITKFDWVCFITALAAIPPWLATKDPTISVCIVTGIELAGFVPTFRKVWHQPYSEDLTYFLLCVLKYGLAIAALDKWSLAAAIYPVVTIWAGITFCIFMVYARTIRRNSANA